SIFDGGAGAVTAGAGAAGADAAGAGAVGVAGAWANAADAAAHRTKTATSVRKNRFTVEVLLSSDRTFVAFTRPDTDRLIHWMHEDLAVADIPGLRGLRHHVRDLVRQMIRDHDLDFDLRQEI